MTAISGGVAAILTAVGTLVMTIRNGRTLKRAERAQVGLADDVHQVHQVVTDGRAWQLGFNSHDDPSPEACGPGVSPTAPGP